MLIFKEGDKVSVIHDTVRGRVVALEQERVVIEDEYGFERTYRPAELSLLSRPEAYGDFHSVPMKDEEDKRLKRVPRTKSITEKKPEINEIDLHIEELETYTAHLSNHEIVQKQLTACRAFVQRAIDRKKKKVVLIHGKGAGVLKSEIRHYLDRLDDASGVQITYHDASFQRYGTGGATEVIISYAY